MFPESGSALGRRLLPVVALVFIWAQAAAVPVHVTLAWSSGTPLSVRANVSIRAVRVAGAGESGAPVEADAGANGAVLNLGQGMWQVQASVPGFWTQGAQVAISRDAPADVRLMFWPAASLGGKIISAEGESLPPVLEVQLSAAQPVAGKVADEQASLLQRPQGPSHAKLQCQINAGAWSCLGPAGLFDVRLEASGYAPRYEWGVNLTSSQSTDFGRTELRRTASVFGQAVRKNESDPTGPCRATLEPDMARHAPSESDRESEVGPDAKTRFSVPLNQRGYFQIVGVPPGRYALFVGCAAASVFRELRVQADSETRIDPPLLLEALNLDISVVPKTDPAGQPWRIVLDETAPHFLRIANEVAVTADGHWTRRGLMQGNYRVTLRGSDGASWLQQYFDLNKSTGILSLRVGSVSVSGRVMMSAHPVRARLIFTNDNGGQSATLVSDDGGRFQGLLPVTAATEQSSWTVEAHVVQPPVTQHLLNVSVHASGGASTWLDLDLPVVPVHGSVVSANGKPQPNAQVTLQDSSGARSTTGTDSAGNFEMLDLPPGRYTATADSYDGSSDHIQVEVTEAGTELKLVLNPYKRTSFSVVSSQGPVADATVQVWIAPGVPRAFVRTDENGRFDVSLPPGTTEVGLTIGAPGYAIKLIRLPISSGSDESSDPHTINLDAAAGTLVLNFHVPGRPMDDSAMLYLVHKGAIQDARTIAGWGSDQAGADNNANGTVPVTVDAIEPGDYALCVITDPSQLAAIWSGASPSDRCNKGSLDEDETLTLSAR